MTYDSAQYWLTKPNDYARFHEARVPRIHLSMYRLINIEVTARNRDTILDVVWVEVDPREMVYEFRSTILAKISVKPGNDEEWDELELNGQVVNPFRRLSGKNFS